MRFALKPTGQGRQVWRDKRHSLSGEAAERTLVAAMAGTGVLDRRFVVVDLDAELGGVAKQRLELGGDRRVIGAGESGRGKSRRRRGGEKLNDQRKRDDETRSAAIGTTSGGASRAVSQAQMSGARGPPKHPPMPHSVAERRSERNCMSARACALSFAST